MHRHGVHRTGSRPVLGHLSLAKIWWQYPCVIKQRVSGWDDSGVLTYFYLPSLCLVVGAPWRIMHMDVSDLCPPVVFAGCLSLQLSCPTSRTHSQCRRHGNAKPNQTKSNEINCCCRMAKHPMADGLIEKKTEELDAMKSGQTFFQCICLFSLF